MLPTLNKFACFSVAAALSLVACSSDDAPPLDDNNNQNNSMVMALDYHRDAKAVLDHYCIDCHTAGGIAPFALTDYASVRDHLAPMSTAVGNDTMPPWLPSDDSVPLRYSRQMRPEDKQLLLDWIKAGGTEGDPAAASRVTIPVADVAASARADLVLDPGLTYQPSMGKNDDYHCFVIDPSGNGTGLAADQYLRAGEVVPGNRSIVHHVVVFSVSAAHVADVKTKDDAEAGPGYTCFGGAGVNSAETVLAWAVGGGVNRLDDTQGLALTKGSIFIMQVHYSLANWKGDGDHTVTKLEFATTPPQNIVRLIPIVNPKGLQIKAGNADASQVIPAPVSTILKQMKLPGTDLTVVSLLPHMHQLGKTINTYVGSQSLVDIQRWQFGWQQTYYLQQPFVVAGNQLLTIECHWDNSDSNQPVVNGMKQPAHDVVFGENSTDEMCVSLVGVQYPRPLMP